MGSQVWALDQGMKENTQEVENLESAITKWGRVADFISVFVLIFFHF